MRKTKLPVPQNAEDVIFAARIAAALVASSAITAAALVSTAEAKAAALVNAAKLTAAAIAAAPHIRPISAEQACELMMRTEEFARIDLGHSFVIYGQNENYGRIVIVNSAEGDSGLVVV